MIHISRVGPHKGSKCAIRNMHINKCARRHSYVRSRTHTHAHAHAHRLLNVCLYTIPATSLHAKPALPQGTAELHGLKMLSANDPFITTEIWGTFELGHCSTAHMSCDLLISGVRTQVFS